MLTSGVVALTATAVVAAPAITPVAQPAAEPAAVAIPVQNTAAVRPWIPLPSPLGVKSAIKAPEASAARSLPPAPSGPAGPTATSPYAAGTSPSTGLIMDIYTAVEPWVAWGFDVAAWAVAWLPWIGWVAADQIEILYNAGEVLVRSWFQAAQDLVNLNWANIPPTLINGVTGGLRTLVRGEINWLFGWLPPLPPIGLTAANARQTLDDTSEAVDQVAAPVSRALSRLAGGAEDAIKSLGDVFGPQARTASVEADPAPAVALPIIGGSLGSGTEVFASRVQTLAKSVTEKLDPATLLTGEKSLFKLPGAKSLPTRAEAKLKLPSLRDLQTGASDKVETVKDRATTRFQKATEAADSAVKRLTKPLTSSSSDAGKSDGAKPGYTPKTKIGQKVQQAAKSLTSKVAKKDGPSE
ncbi:hypothetical protein [Mycolicibacterium brumae]|uniref:PPE family protein n=1 Tax=Mycolicibacterium brumae TaxID=85968 RepID=A0A2G5PF39_9MYCO|nr:hypothetical protein [Mycolicibacterium brumae]MCV7192071.1 hypothetical protein [Mycolicibacterium brumae]PIB76730.1 hypothetical protein CQY22_003505 [Mycolicibacterium brumae]RWA20736.1 hypothetical protein MBRU_03495 [Mycolicibacterium brumae DSM 44177]UWW07835.1 hypothetical protein L2Z93_000869 [Mycolicibacterium brumae]